MTENRTYRKAVVISVLVLLAALVVWRLNRPSQPEVAQVRVGFVIAMTGYGAQFGEAEGNAITLLKEKYPNVVFLIEDNRSDPTAGISAARKLIEVDHANFIYTDLTTVANAILPITDKAGIPLIASVYLKDLLERSKLALRNLPTAREEAEIVLAEIARQHLAPKHILAVGSNDEFGRGAIADFSAVAAERQLPPVGQSYMPDDEQQTPLFARKLLGAQPDVIYIASLRAGLGLLIKELRRAGFRGAILSTDAYAYDYIKGAAGADGKGTIYPDFAGGPELDQFAAAYKQRFRSDSSPVVGLLYDGVTFTLQSQLGLPTMDGGQLVQSMNERQFRGVLGEATLRNREFRYRLVVKVAQ